MVHYTLPNLHKKTANSPRQAWFLALLGLVMLGTVQPAAMALSPVLRTQITQPESDVSLPRPSRAVIRQVRRDLAERLNVQPRRLEMVGFSRETWSDSCLGLAAYNERCAMATVEGWRLELSNGQRSWFYHTDMTAQVIKLESMDDTTLPPQVRDRLIQTIVQQEKVPAASLIITESQPRTWDGCMGIFEPEQMCTMIAIPGYRAIVAGAEQSWVYHVSEDGSQIVQNTTASGSRNGLVPTFMLTDSSPPEQPIADIVFRTIESGSLAGVVSERFLTSDGVIYQRIGRPGSVGAADAVVEKRLSPQQVQQFQQLVINQKFRNLDGLRYITSAAFADYPTITIQAMESNVEYIDLEVDNMPQSLQTVIKAWQQL